MIKDISIHNYRSIQNAEVKLNNLVVLIGANGSGKSNLVKALEFVAQISREGLGAAISHQGGMSSIVPKCVPAKDLFSTHTRISYSMEQEPPQKYAKDKPKPTVCHYLDIKPDKRSGYLLSRESLRFNYALELIEALVEDDRKKVEIANLIENTGDATYVEIVRHNTPPQFSHNFGKSALSRSLLIEWLGLPYDVEKPVTVKSLSRIIKFLQLCPTGEKGNIKAAMASYRRSSILDPQQRMPLDWATQAEVLRWLLARVTRYDFLIENLRQEQHLMCDEEIAPDGKNLPVAIKTLLETDPECVSRLSESFFELAPHVNDFSVENLLSAKEFVQFVESRTGRPVESWNSSDGTLRAFAILLALEMQPDGATVMVEEPELNLHPWAIGTIMRHIRATIEAKGLQVIITTHSPEVLESSNVNEVIVVDRLSEVGSTFTPLHEIVPYGSFDSSRIGQLWTKGLLRGVPVV